MNAKEPTAAATARSTCCAGLLAWLAPRQRGRWATCRGRWIKTVLTAALLITGLSAWAVALVQPWTGRSGDLDVISFGPGVDAAKVRSASVDGRKLVPEYVPPTRKPLRRNPFEGASPPGAAPPTERAGDGTGPAQGGPTAPEPAPQVAPAPTAMKVLERVRGLKLEVILITPAGERWAVIGGESYQEGDAVAGLEIVEIQEGHVRLQQAGMTCLLRME